MLTDFGLAVVDVSSQLTTSGLVIGSPAYMAPERVRGERATIAADLWSLGAMLYAAVEGRDPFERNGTLAVLTAIATEEPGRPERAGALWPVISELLSKDPVARPRAVQVEPDLRRIAGEPGSGQSALPEYLTAPLTTAEFGPEPPLVPGLQPRPRPPAQAPASARSRRPGRRSRITAAAAGLIAIMGIAFGLAYSSAGGSGGRPGAKGEHGDQQPASRTRPTPAKSAPATSPAGPRTGITNTAGYVEYHDLSGLSIKIPAGWHVSHSGQFTYFDNGRPTQVLNRNVLVNSHQAYALYWSTPRAQWATDYHYFRVFAATFRPASPPQR